MPAFERFAGARRAPLIAAAAIVLLLTLVGAVDYAITPSNVPDAPTTCPPTDGICQDAAFDDIRERLERAWELSDGLEARAWLLSGLALVAILFALRVAWRRPAAGSRREPFTDLGVAAVLWLIATLVIAWTRSGGLVDVPTGPMFALGGVCLLIAAAGTLATRSDAGVASVGGRPESTPPRGAVSGLIARYSPGVGAVLTLIAIAIAVGALADSGDPCVAQQPGWLDTVLTFAAIAAAGAAGCGVLALLARRWIVALALLAIGPFFAIVAAFGTFCWN